MIDLDELQRLHEAATPEPWLSDRPRLHIRIRDSRGLFVMERGSHGGVRCHEDAALIVAARNALPALLRLARRARRLEEAAAELIRIDAQCWMVVDREVSDALDALRAALAEGEGE